MQSHVGYLSICIIRSSRSFRLKNLTIMQFFDLFANSFCLFHSNRTGASLHVRKSEFQYLETRIHSMEFRIKDYFGLPLIHRYRATEIKLIKSLNTNFLFNCPTSAVLRGKQGPYEPTTTTSMKTSLKNRLRISTFFLDYP